MAADDGGVFAFGDAQFHGGIAGRVAASIRAIAATPTGSGYWMLGADGGVFCFGDARFFGSLGADGSVSSRRAHDLEPSPNGDGYWIVTD